MITPSLVRCPEERAVVSSVGANVSALVPVEVRFANRHGGRADAGPYSGPYSGLYGYTIGVKCKVFTDSLQVLGVFLDSFKIPLIKG